MRPFLPLITLIFLVACTSETEHHDGKPRLQIKDTSLVAADSQANPYAPVDVSPMDMSYYPVDYPMAKMANPDTLPPLARVIYSRPHLQGRQLFHGLLSYGVPWRLGANEATELDLFSEAMIQQKRVPPGRYILYCIPQETSWTLVFNSNIDSWGLKPDPKRDLYRFDIPVTQTNNQLEYFTMVFENRDAAADLLMAWGNLEARLPLSFPLGRVHSLPGR